MPAGTICYCYLVNIWLQCPPRIPEDPRPTPQHPSALQAEKHAPSLVRLEKIFAQALPKDFNVEKHAQSLARLEKRLAQALQSFLTSHAHDLRPCATREILAQLCAPQLAPSILILQALRASRKPSHNLARRRVDCFLAGFVLRWIVSPSDIVSFYKLYIGL